MRMKALYDIVWKREFDTKTWSNVDPQNVPSILDEVSKLMKLVGIVQKTISLEIKLVTDERNGWNINVD